MNAEEELLVEQIDEEWRNEPPNYAWILQTLEENRESAADWRWTVRRSTLLHLAFSTPDQPPSSFVKKYLRLFPGHLLAADFFGSLPVHLAAFHCDSVDVIDFLTQVPGGYDSLRRPDNNGRLPLHEACCRRLWPVRVFEMLIDRGGSETLQVADNDEQLPLHVACKSGQSLEIIPVLVRAYPQALRITNNRGRLPVHCARRGRRQNRDPEDRQRYQEIIRFFGQIERLTTDYANLRAPFGLVRRV